jgi:hypothetical protein
MLFRASGAVLQVNERSACFNSGLSPRYVTGELAQKGFPFLTSWVARQQPLMVCERHDTSDVVNFITWWWMSPDIARLYQVPLGDQPETYLRSFIFGLRCACSSLIGEARAAAFQLSPA